MHLQTDSEKLPELPVDLPHTETIRNVWICLQKPAPALPHSAFCTTPTSLEYVCMTAQMNMHHVHHWTHGNMTSNMPWVTKHIIQPCMLYYAFHHNGTKARGSWDSIAIVHHQSCCLYTDGFIWC